MTEIQPTTDVDRRSIVIGRYLLHRQIAQPVPQRVVGQLRLCLEPRTNGVTAG